MSTEPMNPNLKWMYAIYGIFLAGLVVQFAPLLALILAVIKRKSMQGTVYESHITWIIYTFVYGFLAGLAFALLGTLFGMQLIHTDVMRLLMFGWMLYRLGKGGMRLRDGKPVEQPKAII